jgi:hypothetical protein
MSNEQSDDQFDPFINFDRVRQHHVALAIRVIESFGRTRWVHHMRDKMSRGQNVGIGLVNQLDASVIVDAAITGLEHWNCHLSAAALRAIEKGEGEVNRLPRSRELLIVLPEYWAKLP